MEGATIATLNAGFKISYYYRRNCKDFWPLLCFCLWSL